MRVKNIIKKVITVVVIFLIVLANKKNVFATCSWDHSKTISFDSHFECFEWKKFNAVSVRYNKNYFFAKNKGVYEFGQLQPRLCIYQYYDKDIDSMLFVVSCTMWSSIYDNSVRKEKYPGAKFSIVDLDIVLTSEIEDPKLKDNLIEGATYATINNGSYYHIGYSRNYDEEKLVPEISLNGDFGGFRCSNTSVNLHFDKNNSITSTTGFEGTMFKTYVIKRASEFDNKLIKFNFGVDATYFIDDVGREDYNVSLSGKPNTDLEYMGDQSKRFFSYTYGVEPYFED